MASGRKARDMSTASKFCLEKTENLDVSENQQSTFFV